MRKGLSILLLALCLLLGGCAVDGETDPTPSPTPTAGPVEQGEFALACYPLAGFHPITGGNRTNLSLGGLVYEGLYEVDPSFEAQGVLAVSNTVSEDGLTWTFTLRQGVSFSDGTPLSAEDVVSSLNQARQSALYSARLSGIASVSAGEGTVVVRLSTPNGALPLLLDVPIIQGGGISPLGTGPYVFTGAGETLALTANAYWWRGEALPVDSIPLRAIQEADDLIYAFDTRDISLVSTDLTGSNALGYSGSYETLDYATSVLLYVGFNTTSGLCRDANLRHALSYGFDRNTVATALLSRHAVSTALPFHPSSPLWDEELAATLTYSPQTMVQMLGEEGWSVSGGTMAKGRQTLSLRLLVNQENTYKVGVADHLAAALTQSGVAVTVEKLPWDEYTAALGKGDFDLYLGEVRLTADFDLTPLVGSGGAVNYGRYSDGTAAGLLRTFRGASDTARQEAASALAERLAQQAPIVPLCFKSWSVLSQWGQVSGMTATQQNVFYHFWEWEIAGDN